MKNSHYSRRFLVAVIILLVMANVGVVFAQGQGNVSNYIYDSPEELNCGDFFGSEYIEGTLRTQIVFDDNGVMLSAIQHQSGRGTMTNSETGKTVYVQVNNNYFYDFTDGVITQTTKAGQGTYFVEGVGWIAHDFGIATLDTIANETVFEGGASPLWGTLQTEGYAAFTALREEVICPILA